MTKYRRPAENRNRELPGWFHATMRNLGMQINFDSIIWIYVRWRVRASDVIKFQYPHEPIALISNYFTPTSLEVEVHLLRPLQNSTVLFPATFSHFLKAETFIWKLFFRFNDLSIQFNEIATSFQYHNFLVNPISCGALFIFSIVVISRWHSISKPWKALIINVTWLMDTFWQTHTENSIDEAIKNPNILRVQTTSLICSAGFWVMLGAVCRLHYKKHSRFP